MDILTLPRRAACAAALVLLAPAAVLAQGASAPAAAPAASASALPRADRDFIIQAAGDGLAEVELGKLAQQKGASDAVKSFGSKMFDDHSKANEELRRIASAKGVTLPAAPGKKHQKDIEKLGKATGADFDRDYARHMVADHKKAVALFEKQAKGGGDAELKAFAAKTLPTLQQHLEHAAQLEKTVKNGKKAGA